MSNEENTETVVKDFQSEFTNSVQPLVNILSSTQATQLYLNRRREGTDGWSNVWDIIIVDPTVTKIDTTVEEPVKKVRKTRAKKAS